MKITSADREQMLLAADVDLANAMRHFARYSPGSTIDETLPGLLLVAGAHPHPGPYRNAAVSFGLLAPEHAVDTARRFFGSQQRSFVFWSPQHINSGLDERLESVGRLLEPDGLPELAMDECPGQMPPPQGIEVRTVTEPSQREDFLHVNVAGWGMDGMPKDISSMAFFDPDILDHPNVRAFIAYRNEEPLAAAAAFVHGDVVGGYWGATVPEARRQGLAEVVVRRMWNSGFAIGATVAVSQGSGSGVRIWERIGFREITRYERWLIQFRV